MTQKNILGKFIKYLDLTSKHYIHELDNQKTACHRHVDKIKQEHINRIQELKLELNKGKCFGMSVCYGAMGILGKLPWWKQVLVEINNWDETAKSLKKFIFLQGSKDNTPCTRGHLFERALHYILFCQTNLPYKFRGHKFHCDFFLKQDKAYFELLDNNNQIQKIKTRNMIAGSFTKDDLELVLDENIIKNTICLIHSGPHTLNLSFIDGYWFLYDANYSHESVNDMNFIANKFEKSKIVDEIFSQLKTHSIIIEVASIELKDIQFSYYEFLLQNSPESLIQEKGLHHILQKCPDVLLKVCQLAEDTKTHPKLSIAIASILQEKIVRGWTGLHLMTYNSPDSLLLLFKLAAKAEFDFLKSAITKTVTEKTDDGWTAVYTMAHYSKECLFSLLQLAKGEESRELRVAIAKALVEKSKFGLTGLHKIAIHAPEVLETLFKLAMKTYSHDLYTGNRNDLTIYSAVFHVFNEICRGSNLLHIMASASSKSLPLFFKIAVGMDGDMRFKIREACAKKNSNGQSVLEIMTRHAYKFLPHVFHFAEAENGLWFDFAEFLMNETSAGRIGFYVLYDQASLEFSSESFKMLFLQAENNSVIRKALVRSFAKRDFDGWRGLYLSAACYPKFLFDALCTLFEMNKIKGERESLIFVLNAITAYLPVNKAVVQAETVWQAMNLEHFPTSEKVKILDYFMKKINYFNLQDLKLKYEDIFRDYSRPNTEIDKSFSQAFNLQSLLVKLKNNTTPISFNFHIENQGHQNHALFIQLIIKNKMPEDKIHNTLIYLTDALREDLEKYVLFDGDKYSIDEFDSESGSLKITSQHPDTFNIIASVLNEAGNNYWNPTSFANSNNSFFMNANKKGIDVNDEKMKYSCTIQ